MAVIAQAKRVCIMLRDMCTSGEPGSTANDAHGYHMNNTVYRPRHPRRNCFRSAVDFGAQTCVCRRRPDSRERQPHADSFSNRVVHNSSSGAMMNFFNVGACFARRLCLPSKQAESGSRQSKGPTQRTLRSQSHSQPGHDETNVIGNSVGETWWATRNLDVR